MPFAKSRKSPAPLNCTLIAALGEKRKYNMAQWMGQYTGRTHESKVKDIEETLLKAIEALKTVDENNLEAKEKSVIHLCERLLSARLKAVKARISKLSETLSFDNDSRKTQNLIKREKHLEDSGLKDIFIEFKIQYLVKIKH